MGRITAWFGGLTNGAKAAVIVGSLVLFVVLSPLFSVGAILVLVVGGVVFAYRALRRRPVRGPLLVVLASLAVLVVASGVSNALYGTSEQAGPGSRDPGSGEEQAQDGREREPTETVAPEATTETTAEATTPPPREEAEPEPDPDPKLKPDPDPKQKPKKDRDRSRYGKTVTVSRVVDGDTVEISPSVGGVEDVRLIGVDTPETVDPGEEVEPYGPEASSFAARELEGRTVDLEFDVERLDQYGRLLAYVHTRDGGMFNEELVAKGYAQAYPYEPNTEHELLFERAQRRAKARDLGIWGLPVEQQCLLADLGNGIGEGSAACDLLAEESASSSATASAGSSATAEASGGGAVAPISEDDCPASAPIKGNQSGLYHEPGGAYYDVTNPEECFATAAAAEAAGYDASSR